VLHIQNLHKSYGQRAILQGLNLHLLPGEIYGLLGPNGAGKTTTIQILCGLVKADRGQIRLQDQQVSEATKALIGLVPQENLLYGSLTAAENLHFFARLYGLSKAQRQERVPQCLDQVGLLDRAKSRAEVLSGGMQRRLSTAIALIHHPKLLILDEPTTGLDIDARVEIWKLIWQLQKQGMTILLTTHLLDEAERLCDRIGILRAGKLVAEGSLTQLRQFVNAQEIAIIQTPDTAQAIEHAQSMGFPCRWYGDDLAFWLPEAWELKEILSRFEGVAIDSIARHPVRLEHIYDEVLKR
jgi:ABC-2 type transport system ATP-binding protein